MNYHFGRGFSRWTPYLLMLPGMLLYFAIALGPSIATSVYSFTDATGLKGAPIHWVGLDNYKEFLLLGQAAKDNIAVLRRTLIFSLFVSTVQFTLGLIAALVLNQRLFGRNVVRTIVFMPVILGAVIQGLIWTLFLYPLGGPAANLLKLFGLQSQFLGGSPAEAFFWVMVVQIWANLGITMIIFLAGLQAIPSDYYEAATVDGANSWQVFRNVTWPLLTPSINTNILLNVIGSLQAWQLFLVLVGYRPGTQVLGYLIYATGFGAAGSMTQSFRQGYAAAASIVLFILVLIIGMTVQTFLRRREERILG